MRGRRSAKFAEYISTYAILHGIGVHPTTLIERRDCGVGVGVYVRDACDAGTTLLVVPSSRVCATSALSSVGAAVTLDAGAFATAACAERLSSGSQHEDCERSKNGVWARRGVAHNETSHQDMTSHDTVTPLLGAECPHGHHDCSSDVVSSLTCGDDGVGVARKEWALWCWRVALERHRTHSCWWGWLQSVPSPEEFAETHARAAQWCRLQCPELYPHYTRARTRLVCEVRAVYAEMSRIHLAPSYANFSWAVDVLLSRSLILPRCFGAAVYGDRWRPRPSPIDTPDHGGGRFAPSCASAAQTLPDDALSSAAVGDEAALELAVVPLMDLINGPDDVEDTEKLRDGASASTNVTPMRRGEPGRCVNAALEVAFGVDELPAWYVDWVREEAWGCRPVCTHRCEEGDGGDSLYGRGACPSMVSSEEVAEQRQRLWQQNSPFFLCLTLTKDVPMSTELILPYALPKVSSGVLSPQDDMLLKRLLKYGF